MLCRRDIGNAEIYPRETHNFRTIGLAVPIMIVSRAAHRNSRPDDMQCVACPAPIQLGEKAELTKRSYEIIVSLIWGHVQKRKEKKRKNYITMTTNITKQSYIDALLLRNTCHETIHL